MSAIYIKIANTFKQLLWIFTITITLYTGFYDNYNFINQNYNAYRSTFGLLG